jgi:hypothetical protein
MARIHDSRHHRKCRSNEGTNDKENIVYVSQVEHRAYHTLFANKDAYGIAQILNETWIDPDYKLMVVRK